MVTFSPRFRHENDVPIDASDVEGAPWPVLPRRVGFLGRKLHPSLAAEVVTDGKRRPEGWRVRHRMAGNWVKVYDKASVLRVETVINNPR